MYDIAYDWEAIVQSFAQQYGIRLEEKDLHMTWEEFIVLLGGISGDTPLGKLVYIRGIKDNEELKKLDPACIRIREEWKEYQDRFKSDVELKKEYEQSAYIFNKMLENMKHSK